MSDLLKDTKTQRITEGKRTLGSGEFEIRPKGVLGFVIRETAADLIALQMLIPTAAEFGNSAEQDSAEQVKDKNLT